MFKQLLKQIGRGFEMSEITVTPKRFFGYTLIVIGLILILHAVFQAIVTFGTIMEFIRALMPNPTLAQWMEQYEAYGMPGFVETIGWALMLFIEMIGGSFIANIGTKFALQKETEETKT